MPLVALRAAALLLFGYFPALALLDRNLDWLPELPWSIPAVVLWVALVIRIVGRPILAQFTLASCRPVAVVAGFSFCVLVAACAIGYLYLSQRNIRLIPVTFRKNDEALGHALHLLTYVAIAAVIEESAFRGMIQAALKCRVGAPTAILLSSATFTVWHYGNAQYALMAPLYFVIGISLSVIFDSTSSLVAAILAHFVYDCVVAVVPGVVRIPFQNGSESISLSVCVAVSLGAAGMAWRLRARLASGSTRE